MVAMRIVAPAHKEGSRPDLPGRCDNLLDRLLRNRAVAGYEPVRQAQELYVLVGIKPQFRNGLPRRSLSRAFG